MSNNVITYGVIFGVISIVLTFLSFNGIILSGLLFFLLGVVALFLVLILAGNKYKANHDGYASMGDLVKSFALIIFIGVTLSTIFSFAYTTMMSEEKKEAYLEKTIEGQIETYSRILDEDALEEMEEQLYDKMSSSIFEPSGVLLGFLISALLYTLLSLIPAAIMKNNPQQHL